jgi:hypothetical protein
MKFELPTHTGGGILQSNTSKHTISTKLESALPFPSEVAAVLSPINICRITFVITSVKLYHLNQ